MKNFAVLNIEFKMHWIKFLEGHPTVKNRQGDAPAWPRSLAETSKR